MEEEKKHEQGRISFALKMLNSSTSCKSKEINFPFITFFNFRFNGHNNTHTNSYGKFLDL